jgi:hypothetical protein
MSGHAPPHGHDEHDDDGFEGEKPKINWLVVIAIVAALLLLAIFPVMSMFNNSSPDVTTTPGAVQITQTPAETGPVACPAFTRERQTCSFGAAGTQAIGYGESIPGLHYCEDKQYAGPGALYRLEYLDPATGEWKDRAASTPTQPFSSQRFASTTNDTVTITYWLNDGACNVAPPEESQVDESAQQPDDAGDSDDEYIPIH